jgi:predicted nucleic acid-binding protein
MAERSAVVSLQVLREFYVVVTRTIEAPLSHEEASEIVRDLARLPLVEEGYGLLDRALDLVGEHHLSLWDAMVVVAAEAARCEVLYSEDLSHGQVIRGVRIENPFVGDAQAPAKSPRKRR